MEIPDGGGIATGGHTVTVRTSTNVDSYSLSLSSQTNDTSLINTDKPTVTIPTLPASFPTSTELENNHWGYNVSQSSDVLPTSYSGIATSSNPDVIVSGSFDAPQQINEARHVTYGVRVNSPITLPAGNYVTALEYTATATIPAPKIISITPNTYQLGSNGNNRVVITGQNLNSASRVYLEGPLDSDGNTTSTSKQYDCTNLMGSVADDYSYQLVCNVPTDQAIPNLSAGTYNVVVVTQGGEDILRGGFTYTESSSQSVYDQQANIRVDFDKGMIPVKYNESTEKWEVVTDRELDSNLDNWFDYGTKKWANAVTVTKDSQDAYYKARAGSDTHYEVNDGDILGYWVYIPRYAYKVMRRESTDRYVDEQNFEIKFETTANPTKTPVESCNADARSAAAVWKDGNRDNAVESNIKVGYYQDCPGVDANYYRDDVNKADSTAWATHPAFTWQYTGAINGFDKTIELNGLWVGKFEMTGSLSEPTILPNQKHLNQNLATLWSAVKSMGLADEYDQANSGVPVAYGKHNLSSSVTHMIKNSEWGAAAYLSASEYGVGAGLINMNQQEQAGVDDMGASSTGVTGCGPLQETGADDRGVSYSDGGRIGTSEACSAGNPERAYNGSLGVLASTTGNEYGVYDMSGGAWDYALGNVTSGLGNATTVSPYEFVVDIEPPYVDLYRTADGFDGERPAWWITGTNMSQEEWNTDVCTWDTCGGHALYETENFQINNSVFQRSWSSGKYGTDAFFPILDISINPDGTINSSPQPWIARGSAAGWWSGGTTGDSIFAYNVMAGDPNAAARAVLMSMSDL